MKQTWRLALIGAALGATASILAMPILSSLLSGIRPVETFVILSVLTLTLFIATLTAWLAALPWMSKSPTNLLA